MKKFLCVSSLAVVLFCASGLNAQPRPTVTDLNPTSGTPGAFVQISGENFGREQGDKLVLMIFGGTPSHISIPVFSWSNNLIEARIPGPEDYDYTGKLGRTPIDVRIKVYDPHLRVIAGEGLPFTLKPSSWSPFSVYRVVPGIVAPESLDTEEGRTVTIYGNRIPVPQGDYYVFLKKSGVRGAPEDVEVVSWNQTHVTIRLPADLDVGRYLVSIKHPDPSRPDSTVGSNTIYLDISHTVERPAMGAELRPSTSTERYESATPDVQMQRQPERIDIQMRQEEKEYTIMPPNKEKEPTSTEKKTK